MKWTVLLIFVLLLFPAPALAQEPTPTPVTPYVFEPVDYESEEPLGLDLADLIKAPTTINSIGSYAVTLWSMLDNFAGGGVLAIFVIFLAGLWVIRHVARFVYSKPLRGDAIEAGRAIEDVDVDASSYGRAWAQFGNELRRRKRF